MKAKTLTTLLLGTILAGCSMVPDRVVPTFSASQDWNNVAGYEQNFKGEKIAQLEWRNYFLSPELHQVIETALEHNKDLRLAALNIDEARALYRIERADLLPNIDAAGSGAMTRSSDESSVTGRDSKSELYEANLGVTAYELDLFGKVRSANEAALNEYLSTQEAQAVVRNALVAETANAYLQLLANQKLLFLTQQTLNAQQRTLSILERSLEQGISTQQDVARARTAVETARVNEHHYSRYVAQDQNALFLLMGIPQGNNLLPVTSLDDIKIVENLNPATPSEVLLMRPDVRQAEFELWARNADIGAAKAAFFPSISLTGAYGLASADLSDLFSGSAFGAWSFLPQITLPIFAGGRNQANLDLAEIRKEQAVINYESAIQNAFREVSDELAAHATLSEQLKAQRRLVAASQEVYDISNKRYKSGIDSFLSVLDSQRELYIHQQNEIEIERLHFTNMVNLYKVLGGGSYTSHLDMLQPDRE